MWVNKGNHSGSIGKKVGYNRDQRYGVSPKTSYVPPESIIDLAALFDVSDATFRAISLDGQIWLVNLEDYGDVAISWTIDSDTGELEVKQGQAFPLWDNDVGDVVQTGWDWILTTKLFISHDARNDEVYYKAARAAMPLMLPSDIGGVPMPATVGYTNGFMCDRETNWLFGWRQKDPNLSPYWERLNEPLCGMQILHDWVIMRGDLGFNWGEGYYDSTGLSWSLVGSRYVVFEPQNVQLFSNANACFKDSPPNSTYQGCWNGPLGFFNNTVADEYAAFVIDGQLYLRSKNYFGTAKLMFMQNSGDKRVSDPLGMFCMADYDIWRKNYPDFDWDNSCLGKIGEMLVLFETAEHKRPQETLSIMRLALTGRYIPVINKVDWETDRTGTNPALVPPLMQLTGPDGDEELSISLSSARNAQINRAYGYDKEILKTFRFDKDGTELFDNESTCLKGANGHFMPGGNPVEAGVGRYIVSRDKNKFFVSDLTPPLMQRIYSRTAGQICLNTQEEEVTVGTETKTKYTERMYIIGANPGAVNDASSIGVDLLFSAETVGDGYARRSYSSSLWSEISTHLCSTQEIRTQFGTSTAADVYPGGLPAWNFPIIAKPDYIVSDGGNPAKFRFEFGWLNPTNGSIASALILPLDEYDPGELGVSYDTQTGEIRFGEIKYNGTTEKWEMIMQINVPSYLADWVGMTDMYFTEARLPARSAPQLSGVNFISGHGEGDLISAIRNAPVLEIHERLPVISTYHIFDTSRTGRAGDFYNVNGYFSAQYGFFNTPCWDLLLSLRYNVGNETAIGQLILTADGFVLNTNGHLYTPSRTHHQNNTFWGFEEPTVYPIALKCMAHYVQHSSRFKTLPHFYADDQFSVEIPAWRYSVQLNVFKARMGEKDLYNANQGDPWQGHGFIMWRTDFDQVAFNDLIKPTRLINPFIYNKH
jgi:hypothetical protein